MNVLAIVAHPDDETLGCGGTIAKHAAAGDAVTVVSIGSGIGSREKPESVGQRIEQFGLAMRTLGAKRHRALCMFEDNSFDATPLLVITKVIEKEIDNAAPDVIYTHHEHDLNVDHRLVYQAVLTACRAFSCKAKRLLCFEVPSSTEAQRDQGDFNPSYFSDITGCFSTKIDAIKCYKDELRDFPHPRSEEGLKTYAQWRGMQCGKQLAEAFEIVRWVE